MDRGGRIARASLRVAVTAAITSYILASVDREQLWRVLSAVRPTALLWPLALYLAGQVLSAIKWAVVGRGVGLAASMASYVRFYFIGMFFNLFGPGTIGGDVVRALYLGRNRPGLAASTVLFDRASGLAFLLGLGAAAMLAFPGYRLPIVLVAGVVASGLALVVGWWTFPWIVRFLPGENRIRRQVEQDLAPLWNDRGLLARVAVLSLAFHAGHAVLQYALARAVGASVPLAYCFVFHPILSVMMALPVSVGGFGVREGGYLYFLGRVGVDDSVAVTIGLLWWAVCVLGGSVGGVVFLASGGRVPRSEASGAAA